MRPDLRLRACVILALILAAAATARAQPPPLPTNGVLLNTVPMYLTPDPSRVPLATLPSGTTVRVMAREGDWYRVVFRDRYLGDRTGYILAAAVRLEAPAPLPPPSPRTVPGQIAPPSSAPVIVRATPMKRRYDNGYASLNGTMQRDSTAFSTTSTFRQGSETGTIATSYGGVESSVADFGLGQRVGSIVGVGVAATFSSQITDASVTATVPRVLSPNNPFTVSGVASQIRRQELGVHIQVSAGIPRDQRVQVAVFGGPSLFRVKQGLVTAINANQATGTFGNATVVESSKNRVGANAGIDASVVLWRALGVGVIVRYSQAMIPFKPAEGVDVTIEPGGLQIGGGLRFRF